jgi:hypothetical protein
MAKQSRGVYKISVESALENNPLQNALRCLLEDAVIRVNRIADMAYQLMNLHLLYLLENNQPIPQLGQNYLRVYYYAVSYGDRVARVDVGILEFRDRYFPLFDAVSRDGVSRCLELHAKQMATDIRNNIVVRFWKRQWYCLQSEHRFLTKVELRALQTRIYNGQQPHRTVPSAGTLPVDKPLAYHLKKSPHLFLRPMYDMLQFLKGSSFKGKPCKPFALLPMRRAFVPGAILLDSEALYQLTHHLPVELLPEDIREVRRKYKEKVSCSTARFLCFCF